MNETFITLSINKFLNENNYIVIQCIPPGGQGGLYFSTKNKRIYPDLIFFKDNIMYIGENKPDFSESDEKKLLLLSKEINLKNKAQKILDEYLLANDSTKFTITRIEMVLGFSKNCKMKSLTLQNLLVDKNGNVDFLKY